MAAGEPGVEVPFDLKERAMDEAPVGITISDPDRPDNPLIYVNRAFERVTGYPRSEVLGNNCRMLQGPESDPETVARMREAIDAEEPVQVEILNYRKDGTEFWNEVTIAPLTNHAGEVTNFVGFQADVTARKEAELALERERANLAHLVERINGLLGDVTETLMRAVAREGTEREICERIVSADPYVFAWFAEPDRVHDVLLPSTWAGSDGSIADFSLSFESDEPTARAFRAASIQTANDLTGSPLAGRIDGVRSVAAVPLTYGETTYGVLTVYGGEPAVFDDNELVVIEALGRSIATAINAAESRRILVADNYVELEFAISDRSFFPVKLSAELDCEFDFEGSVARNGDLSMFFTADADHEAIIDYSKDIDEIETVSHVSGHGESTLVKFDLATGSIIADLAERGVKTRAIALTDGTGRMTLELPPETDSRAIVNRFRDRYPASELVAYRERERPPTTKQEFIAGLEDRLTDRQLTALRTAFVSGYYDSNRRTAGDALAESMGISRATFHQHLRAAERKLVAEFFER